MKKEDNMYNPGDEDQLKKYVLDTNRRLDLLKKELRKVVVGQEKVLNDILVCLLAKGNILLEGAPGLAKTLMIKALSTVIGGSFKRIQFTADLLPTDITGFEGYEPNKGFFTFKGPVFSNFVLADEINRAPPKVQSALMEVMQELQVTIGKQTYQLERPFMVLATENPLETKGVYILPEAQLDRFLFKTLVDYPSIEEEKIIMEENISIYDFEQFKLNKIISLNDVLNMQDLVLHIFLHNKLKDYIAEMIDATRNPDEYGVELGKFIEWGGSPRASINLYIASKAKALMNGRTFVVPQDIKDVAHNVLRHRIILSYDAKVQNITTDRVINEILSKIKVP